MKASTYKEFRKLRKSIDALTKAVVDRNNDDANARAQRVADDLNSAAGALNTAVPATPAK